jgi:uncharacterized lipoprotein YmbA
MSLRERLATRRAIAIAATVLALGCLGRSPQVRFYAISAVQGTAPDRASDLAIGVGPLSLPRYLDQPQLVTRVHGSRLAYDEQNRWAGGLESNVLRALGDDLSARLGTQRVVVYPAAAPFPLDYRVTLDIFQFDGRPGGELVLRARWIVHDGSGEAGPWSAESEIRHPLPDGDVESLVAAHAVALGELAGEIAARIASADAQ